MPPKPPKPTPQKPPRQTPKYNGLKSDGGRISKKERVAIQRESERDLEYCWVDSCFRFEPCPNHFAAKDPRHLACFIDIAAAYLKEKNREYLIPCLLPLVRAIRSELEQQIALEIKEVGFAGGETKKMLDITKQNETKFEKDADELSRVHPPQPPPADVRRMLAIMEKRIARMHADNERAAKCRVRIVEQHNTYVDSVDELVSTPIPKRVMTEDEKASLSSFIDHIYDCEQCMRAMPINVGDEPGDLCSDAHALLNLEPYSSNVKPKFKRFTL